MAKLCELNEMALQIMRIMRNSSFRLIHSSDNSESFRNNQTIRIMRNSSFRLIHLSRIIRKVSEIAKLSELNEIARQIMRIMRNSSFRLIQLILKVCEMAKF